MLDVANRGDWSTLVELEEKRRPLIKEYIEAWHRGENDHISANDMRKFIDAVQQKDHCIMQLAQKGREDAAEQLMRLKERHNAAVSYLSNSG